MASGDPQAELTQQANRHRLLLLGFILLTTFVLVCIYPNCRNAPLALPDAWK